MPQPPTDSSAGAPTDVVTPATTYNTAVRTSLALQAAFTDCGSAYVGGMVGMLFLFLLLFIYGACRRSAMRAKFGLPGDNCADAAAWLCCCWAAICQEARTLRHNGVERGEWVGAAAAGKSVLLAPRAQLEMEAV